MSLESSVDLVLHAFTHGEQGDIFVQKSPASTILALAEAIQELFQQEALIDIIGTRHGEKLYETLISREEMVKAIDLGKYFRIPCDTRDLNYNIYITEGNPSSNSMTDYTSHAAKLLSVSELTDLLKSLPYIQNQLGQ